MRENALKIVPRAAMPEEKVTELNEFSQVESGANALPHIFTRQLEEKESFVSEFYYVCEKAAFVRDGETKKALDAIESFQLNIANWIANISSEKLRFSQKFCFDPVENKMNILFTTSVRGDKEDSVKENALGLAYELRDLIRLNAYHRFLPVTEPDSSRFDTVSSNAVTLSEIKIGHRTIPVNSTIEMRFSEYPSTVEGSSSMSDFIRVFLDKTFPGFVEIVFEKVIPTQHERKEFEALVKLLKITSFNQFGFGLIQPIPSAANHIDINDEIRSHLIDLARSVAAGRAIRVRYFMGLHGNDLGASPMCFIKNYIGTAKYMLSQVSGNEGQQTSSLLTEVSGVAKSKCTKLMNLHDVITAQQLTRLFKVPLPGQEGVAGMEAERLHILKAPAKLLNGRSEGLLLARCFSNNGEQELRIQTDELLRHLYVCGMTGTGKTTLLRRLCFSLADASEGFTLIDPHGDLARDVFVYTQSLRMPEYRSCYKAGVAYLDFEDKHFKYGIDLFKNDGSDLQKSQIIEEIVSMIFRTIKPSEMAGPMFEKYFRVVLRTLVEGGISLCHFNKVVMNRDFRNRVLTQIKEKKGDDLYEELRHELEQGDAFRGDNPLWPYITCKMVRFCDSEILQRLLDGGCQELLDFKELMNNRAIIIVRLPVGVIPETIAYIIGMIINMRINLAAKERIRVTSGKRTPYFLVIDEFQNFVSTTANFSYSEGKERDLTSILSEARKYGLGLVIANQYISQLDRGAREAIFGNVGSKIAFRVGIEDANYLARTFTRTITSCDFTDLPNFHGYASMLLNNMYADPFTIKTLP
ncbi:MAG: DUF87 domain-containing protein [bacterium]